MSENVIPLSGDDDERLQEVFARAEGLLEAISTYHSLWTAWKGKYNDAAILTLRRQLGIVAMSLLGVEASLGSIGFDVGMGTVFPSAPISNTLATGIAALGATALSLRCGHLTGEARDRVLSGWANNLVNWHELLGAFNPGDRIKLPDLEQAASQVSAALALLKVTAASGGATDSSEEPKPCLDADATAYRQTARHSLPIEQYVTLDQMAAMVSRSKRTLEKRKNRKNNPLPAPDVEGGGGKPDEWLWAHVRPWLEREFSRQLPERFPQRRPPS